MLVPGPTKKSFEASITQLAAIKIGEGVGEAVGVAETFTEGVAVGVGVAVSVGVGVAVAFSVGEGGGVAVAVGKTDGVVSHFFSPPTQPNKNKDKANKAKIVLNSIRPPHNAMGD